MPLNQADQLKLSQKRAMDYYAEIDSIENIDTFMPVELRYKHRRILDLSTNKYWYCETDGGSFIPEQNYLKSDDNSTQTLAGSSVKLNGQNGFWSIQEDLVDGVLSFKKTTL